MFNVTDRTEYFSAEVQSYVGEIREIGQIKKKTFKKK